jgi:hypothetical protein
VWASEHRTSSNPPRGQPNNRYRRRLDLAAFDVLVEVTALVGMVSAPSRRDDPQVEMPRAVSELPLLLRFALLGAVALGAVGSVVGFVVGFVIGLHVYAGTAWAAAAEVGLPSGLAGAVLGVAVGTTKVLLVRPRSSSHR